MGCPDSELSILILDDPQIEELNMRYLNRKGPTNVIAFPLHDGGIAETPHQLLGDVVLSVETAFSESEAAGIEMNTRMNQLLIHGVLHLLGYDHEKSKTEAKHMEKKSDELLNLIK